MKKIIKSTDSSNTQTFIYLNYDLIQSYYKLREMMLLGLKPLKKTSPYMWDPDSVEDDLYK